MYNLIIKVDNQIIEPSVKEPVTWTTNWRSTPGSLKVDIISPGYAIPKGTEIQFWDGEDKLFFGYVFKTQHKKDKIVSITAYDQLRYLKNKDYCKFVNMTASEILKKIASDTYLRIGNIEDTGYKIAVRDESNSSYFDMIQKALDITLTNTKKLYILDDDFGKLRLRSIANTEVGILFDEESAENYDFSSSIDSETYNQIKLVQEDSKSKKRKLYIAKDSSTINKWGLLQLTDKVGDNENGQVKADALLTLHNKETKTFTLDKAFGDNRIRAGIRCYVKLDTEDEKIDCMMLVEKATHKYYFDEHTMDLEFRSGTFS